MINKKICTIYSILFAYLISTDSCYTMRAI